MVDQCTTNMERINYPTPLHRSAVNNGRFKSGLGSLTKRQESPRILGQIYRSQSFEHSRNVGRVHGPSVIQERINRENDSNSFRQYYYSSIPKQNGRIAQGVERYSYRDLGGSDKQSSINSVFTYSGQGQLRCRLSQSSERQVRVEITPRIISILGRNVGTAHDRPFRVGFNNTVTKIQQPISQSVSLGYRRVGTARLGVPQQLRKPSVPTPSSSIGRHSNSERGSNNNSTRLEGSTLVPETVKGVNKPSVSHQGHGQIGVEHLGTRRAAPKPPLETLRLEDIWEKTLKGQGWSDRVIPTYRFYLAPSTLSLYNSHISVFYNYCLSIDTLFPPTSSGVIADFLKELSLTSERPRSKLNCTIAAINSMYDALNVPSPCRLPIIKNMVNALVRAHTKLPMKKSTILPVGHFCDMFNSWTHNGELSIKDLRLKAITLLSLAGMLRPSDIAPRTQSLNTNTSAVENIVFSTRQLDFVTDGSLKIHFFGIKNDTNRDGFEVQIQPHSCEKLDPVRTLRTYVERTNNVRDKTDSPVFLSLKRPFKAIDSSTVASILNEAISRAGLENQGLSAKSFRPTGATAAIAHNYDPNVVRKIGRWKTESVFFDHYVHSRTPEMFTDDLIK